jgi:hypothetical protein
VLAGIAELAARDADLAENAFEAEQLASSILGTIRAAPAPPGEDVEALFLPGFIAALEALGSRKALATLRAVAVVSAHEHAAAARDAADRLALAGMPEPVWVRGLGSAEPVAAALMHEETFDDGLSVLVEFAAPNSRRTRSASISTTTWAVWSRTSSSPDRSRPSAANSAAPRLCVVGQRFMTGRIARF